MDSTPQPTVDDLLHQGFLAQAIRDLDARIAALEAAKADTSTPTAATDPSESLPSEPQVPS